MKEKNFISALFQFAFFPNYDIAIEFLAEKLADPEDWNFSDSTDKRYPILKNYLEHTFRKINSESKVAYTNDNSHACFNTGLVTRNLEPIYALFEANRYYGGDNSPAFCFKAFVKESDIQFLKVFPDNHPDIADFFQEPRDLIFNPKCKLIPQLDHIIEDNSIRFPYHLQHLDINEVRRRLEGAIEEAKKRVKTNYKLAVPQFYKNRIQLLLPLNLTPGSPNPDLALAVHKLTDDTYTARTCLTLKMAYNNARLIVKPQSSWLKP
ncbi:hypothetical protein CBG53_02085 [Porphyromonas gingivalis]|uniref:DUF3825 domain-containing protein n=1 Tax=Porphyromonas gingivalis TaxID=837 RepID=UPI0003AD2AA5|nr:DUF3825 domain-containing protein [Porphyromonas gingivalis]ERJ71628.1 hypothetical protein HMPREF1554_00048 [Porphyromonas gingivalis F0569]OWP34697.1 hypothetical protein CBG53_02085 [Porphyromonas gingivalis]OWR75960.1 hypothetical protein SJDPG11_09420 [Porphyromonas gingivalis SJD11]